MSVSTMYQLNSGKVSLKLAVPVKSVPQQVLQAAVAQADGDVRERNARLAGLRDAVLVVVDEGPRVEVRLPLGRRDVAHVANGAVARSELACSGQPSPTGVERPSTS